jgi:hypothetical protein
VVAAVRAELDGAPAAAERPGLAAAALALAAILDDPQHVAVQPAAARQLVGILGTLSKRTQRRGKLAVVKSMTTTSPPGLGLHFRNVLGDALCAQRRLARRVSRVA